MQSLINLCVREFHKLLRCCQLSASLRSLRLCVEPSRVLHINAEGAENAEKQPRFKLNEVERCALPRRTANAFAGPWLMRDQ